MTARKPTGGGEPQGRPGIGALGSVSIRETKELGARAYPDPKSPVRRILDSLPDELPVADFGPVVRALLAVSDL